MSDATLGDSAFNYPLDSYSPARFLHYRQQILIVLGLAPRNVLEVGPGDHAVTDFLRRKGVTVHTFDNDPELHPDVLGDVREPIGVSDRYDVVMACEVLEHMDHRSFMPSVANLAAVVRPGGHLVLSLPYSTIRLFPPRGRRRLGYRRGGLEATGVFSSEGRLRTGVPLSAIQPALTVAAFVYRVARGNGFRAAWRPYRIDPLPDDRFDAHHWDLGLAPTTLRSVRRELRSRYRIVGEHVYTDTNSAFFVVRVDERVASE